MPDGIERDHVFHKYPIQEFRDFLDDQGDQDDQDFQGDQEYQDFQDVQDDQDMDIWDAFIGANVYTESSNLVILTTLT